MATHGFSGIRASSIAKNTEEKRTADREKAMLLFTFQMLLDKGYVDTATCLASECSLNLDQYGTCENIDLNSIFIDFEAYYSLRFQKHPQYFRKLSNGPSSVGESLLTKLAKQKRNATCSRPRHRGSPCMMADGDHSSSSNSEPLEIRPSNDNSGDMDRILKPISGLDFPNEDMRYFAEMIQKEIVSQDLDTKWEDVIGLDKAKMVLMESMIYRQEFTKFFGNTLPPWKGLLLYGPVGTGKTLLARAVASECGTTFFNMSSSTLVSKWRGDSEKITKVLFELAKHNAPSTIFFDEFDAIASNRDSSGESDASRRLKSELLQQMDGLLSKTDPNRPIFILAATNLPWELDPAILRRLEKRVYVPLPNAQERKQILKLHLSKTANGIRQHNNGSSMQCKIDFDAVAKATEGYSGSDLHQLIKETVILKFRRSLQGENKSKCLDITTQDIAEALANVLPTVSPSTETKFTAWNESFKGI